MRTVLDNQLSTDAKHGSPPGDRNLAALLTAGWILIDKPAGPTSHQVSAWAREILGLDRLGHGGTLDPFATGVLTLLCGKSMRVTQTVLGHQKEYIAVLRFPEPIDDIRVDEVFSRLTGEIWNVPPKESAVRVQVRSRIVHSFDRLDSSDRLVVARIECSAGTYVRTLARDLGLLIDGRVELLELRRTRSGRHSVDRSVTMSQLVDAAWCSKELGDDNPMRRIVRPIEGLFTGRSGVVVKDGAAAAVAHGAGLARAGVAAIDGRFEAGDEIIIRSLKDELVAVAESQVSSVAIQEMSGGIVARPQTVLLGSDVYPRTWNET